MNECVDCVVFVVLVLGYVRLCVCVCIWNGMVWRCEWD